MEIQSRQADILTFKLEMASLISTAYGGWVGAAFGAIVSSLKDVKSKVLQL